MEKKELTCIGCPLGCQITVTMENGSPVEITGNTCERGKAYAQKEVTNPTRIVCSTMKVEGGDRPYVSCKTQSDIPKGKIFEVMEAINKTHAKAPIQIGDVLLEDVAGTGIPVVATKAVNA